ncbi:transcription termination factor, RNA polymerase II, partial [Linderina pennispora]
MAAEREGTDTTSTSVKATTAARRIGSPGLLTPTTSKSRVKLSATVIRALLATAAKTEVKAAETAINVEKIWPADTTTADEVASSAKTADTQLPATALVPGFRQELYGHQMEACSLMSELEHSSSHGGVLADEAGLGRRVSLVAHVLKSKSDCAIGSSGYNTLIVVRNEAGIEQWEAACKDMLEPGALRISRNHGKSRLSASQMCKNDIVITTSGILRNSSASNALFANEWHRVVVDHHMPIRQNTPTNTACQKLTAKNRWFVDENPTKYNMDSVLDICKFLEIAVPEMRGKNAPLSRLDKFMIRRLWKDTKTLTLEVKEEKISVKLPADILKAYDLLSDLIVSHARIFSRTLESPERLHVARANAQRRFVAHPVIAMTANLNDKLGKLIEFDPETFSSD